MTPFLNARGQRVEVDIDPTLGEAEIDPSKISDVLTNLVINAVKFTPDHGVLRVIAEKVDSENVRFTIADQGVGIAPEVRPYVFEPFFTGFDTMHHSSGDFEFCKKGIGLGLCLVKRFVDLHQGQVEFTSEPGRGSTFTVTLPRRQQSALRASDQGTRVPSLPGSG